MKNIRIIKAGVLDTVQDLGRRNWQHLGVNTGGAMDRIAATIANFLVGNPASAPVIEMHFPAASLFFEQSALIALAGADFSATINGDEVPLLHPIVINKYSILQFHNVLHGARVYLSVNGGLNVTEWLGSYSTHLKAGAGGFRGRALQTDDEIEMTGTMDCCALIGKREFVVLPWKADTVWGEAVDDRFLLLPGAELSRLCDRAKELLIHETFLITHQSDRMGYQLKAEPLELVNAEEMISTGVCFGTIQLPPGGQPILLMADHQTAGGYPRIAHVVTAQLGRLAQKRPGESIRFGWTDIDTAENLLIKQQRHLSQLQNACIFRLQEWSNEQHRS